MRRRAAARWPVLLALFGTLLAVLPRLNVVGLHEDEGVVAAWAALVADGRVPYRDFFAFSTPGSMLIYGADYRLFGVSLLADRLLTSAGLLLAVGFLAVIAQRFLPPAGAFAVALLWGVWLPVFLGYSQYHFWAVTWSLGATLAALKALDAGARGWWAAAGGLAVLAFLFLQTFATVGVALLLLVLLRARPLAGRLAAFAGGAMVPGLAILGYLAATGALGPFLADTAGFTVGTYRSFNRVPFPWNPVLLGDTLNWRSAEGAYWEFFAFWLLAILLPVAVAVYAAVSLTRRRASELTWLAVISSGFFAAMLVGRAGGPLAWLSAALALVVFGAWLDSATRGPRQLLALAPVIVLLLAGLSPGPLGWALSCDLNPGGVLRAASTPAGQVCARPADAAVIREAVALVDSDRDRRVAFLPTALELYQLTRTQPIGQPLWMLPGLDSPGIVADDERALLDPGVGYVLYVRDPDLDRGHPWRFDSFLQANYEVVDSQPGYLLYRRR